MPLKMSIKFVLNGNQSIGVRHRGFSEHCCTTEIKQTSDLKLPLSMIELYSALKLMPKGETPGPDGFPAEFYKDFWPLISPIFYRMVSRN